MWVQYFDRPELGTKNRLLGRAEMNIEQTFFQTQLLLNMVADLSMIHFTTDIALPGPKLEKQFLIGNFHACVTMSEIITVL